MTFRCMGYHGEGVERDTMITVTAKSGKSWSVVESKTYDSGSTSLSAVGKTYVVDLVVDKDLS